MIDDNFLFLLGWLGEFCFNHRADIQPINRVNRAVTSFVCNTEQELVALGRKVRSHELESMLSNAHEHDQHHYLHEVHPDRLFDKSIAIRV